MKILFIGLGSIGQRHLRILRELYDFEVFALRSHKGGSYEDAALTELSSWDEVDTVKPDVAFITNPTNLHIQTALECANRNIKLFIEKPVDVTTHELDNLLNDVANKKLYTYVAFCMRYHPILQALKAQLVGEDVIHARIECMSYYPAWRPDQDHLKSYTASQERGGGVVFELAHEIDYAQYLFGPIQSLSGRAGKLSDVTVDADDYADLHIRHAKCLSTVHLNLFSHQTKRSIEVCTKDGFYHADLIANTLMGQKNGAAIDPITIPNDKDDWFRAQMKDFFDHIDDGNSPNDLISAAQLHKQIVDFGRAKA